MTRAVTAAQHDIEEAKRSHRPGLLLCFTCKRDHENARELVGDPERFSYDVQREKVERLVRLGVIR